jgi:hypothetical protein
MPFQNKGPQGFGPKSNGQTLGGDLRSSPMNNNFVGGAQNQSKKQNTKPQMGQGARPAKLQSTNLMPSPSTLASRQNRNPMQNYATQQNFNPQKQLQNNNLNSLQNVARTNIQTIQNIQSMR